jgi:hypothetical protein
MTHDELDVLYRQCLDPASPSALRVLEDLALACGAAETSHAPGDPCATAFNEGKRAVWLYVAGRLGLALVRP